MAHEHTHASGDQEHVHDPMHECIQHCLDCYAVCTMAAQYAINEGGALGDVEQVGLLLDCADICRTSADFMLRGSPFHVSTCAVCAEICRAAESACRALSAGDERMAECAETCSQCAESCEAMASAIDDEEEESNGDD